MNRASESNVSTPPSTIVDGVSVTTAQLDLPDARADDHPKVTVELIHKVREGQTPSPPIPSLPPAPSSLPALRVPNCSDVESLTIEQLDKTTVGADPESFPPSAPAQPYARSAPVRRLVHQLDRPLLGPLLVALLNILLCLAFLCPTLFVIIVILPIFATLNCAISVCLNKQHRFSTLLSGPERFWHTRRTVSECVLTLDVGLGLSEVRNLVQTRVLDARNESGRKLFPKFTQKLVSIRSCQAWVNDETFDIAQHVFSAALPSGEPTEASREELLRCAGRLASQELPKDLPPWQMHIFGKAVGDGVGAGPGDGAGVDVRCTTILFRFDPCLCDGVTLMRIFNRRLADRSAPCERKKLFGPIDEVFNLIRAVCSGLLTIIKTVLSYDDYNLLHGPKMSHQRQVTCSESIPLAKVMRITDVTRSHLNDILLAVLSGTLRDYQIQHGVSNPYDLTSTLFVSMQKTRIYHGAPSSNSSSVPAHTEKPEARITTPTDDSAQNKPEVLEHGSGEDSVVTGTHRLADSSNANGSGPMMHGQRVGAETRGGHHRGGKGVSQARLQGAQLASNTSTWMTDKVKLSLVNVTLPVNTEGAVPQLWEVRQRMNEVRSSVDHVVFYYCQTIFWHLLPGCIRERIWRLYYGQSTLLISSLVGPEETISLADSQVKDVTYWVPALDDVSLAVSFVTYAGQLRLSLSTDTGVIPDPDTIASLFVYKMDVLSQLLANRRIPGERTLRLMRRRTSMLEPNATEIRNRIDDVERQLKDLESGYGQRGIGGPGGGGGRGASAAAAAEDAVIADRVANLRVEFQDMLQDLRHRLSEIHSEVDSYESDDDVDDDEEEDGELRRPSRLHSFSGVSRGSFLSVLSASTSCIVQAVSPTRSQDHLPTTITVVAPGCSAAAPPGDAMGHLSKRRHLSDQRMDPSEDGRRESCKSQVSVRMEQGHQQS